MRELDDIVVTFVPEAWSATRLVRVVGRTRELVTGIGDGLHLTTLLPAKPACY